MKKRYLQYTKPKVYIPRNLFNKIQFYVDNCDKEIGGLGVVEIHPEENAYIVKKIVLLKQTVTGSTTDLDEDDIRFCCLVKINVNLQDLSDIYCLSKAAITKKKYRIKKDKLGICDATASLDDCLKEL